MNRLPIAAFGVLALAITLGPAQAQEARPEPPVLKETSADFPKADKVEARIMTATIQPGATSVWHTHPTPVAVYVMEGAFTLEHDGQPAVTKKAGEALLESPNVKVRAANHGQTPTKVVIFQISEPQKPFLDPVK